MAPSNLQHRRTHNLLLISKLLNQRDAASPFTLLLDSLEQSGKPLVAEYVKRAKVSIPIGLQFHHLEYYVSEPAADSETQASKAQIIFVSFETLRKPRDVDVFIPAWSQDLPDWQKEVTNHLKSEPTQSMDRNEADRD